jgi:hypothetical protein
MITQLFRTFTPLKRKTYIFNIIPKQDSGTANAFLLKKGTSAQDG